MAWMLYLNVSFTKLQTYIHSLQPRIFMPVIVSAVLVQVGPTSKTDQSFIFSRSATSASCLLLSCILHQLCPHASTLHVRLSRATMLILMVFQIHGHPHPQLATEPRIPTTRSKNCELSARLSKTMSQSTRNP